MRGTNRPWMYGEDPTPDDLARSGYLKKTKTCGVPGCSRPRARRGGRGARGDRQYCHAHTMHLRRYGQPRAIGRTPAKYSDAEMGRAVYLTTHGCTQQQAAVAMKIPLSAVNWLIRRSRSATAVRTSA